MIEKRKYMECSYNQKDPYEEKNKDLRDEY